MRHSNLKNIAAILLLAFGAAFILFLTNIRSVGWDLYTFPYVTPGKIAHYYINYYDFGFVKRGLVGTVIKTTGISFTITCVRFLAFGIGISLCTVISAVIIKMRERFTLANYILIFGLLILSPATLQNFGYDLGRYDQLLIIFSVLSFYFIYKGEFGKLWVLTVLGLLVHELYAILFFPIVLYASISYSHFDRRKLVYLVLTAGGILLLIFLFGQIETLSTYKIAEITSSNTGLNFERYGVIWKRTLWENIQYTIREMTTFGTGTVNRLLLGAMYTFFVFLLLIILSILNGLDSLGYVVILIGSLPIFLFGIDYSRWYSLMMTNAFVFFIFRILDSEIDRFKISSVPAACIIIIILSGIILGPIGVIRSFPLFDLF